VSEEVDVKISRNRVAFLASVVCALSLPAAVAVLMGLPPGWALPLSEARIIIEVNATDGDAGLQIFADGDGWTRLEVFDPTGQQIVDVSANGGVELQGITEIFFESAEPSFEEQTLDELFLRFPSGMYTFVATTDEGKILNGRATLSHAIPAGPEITSPEEDAVVDAAQPVVISWEPVTEPFPDTDSPVKIIGYQVIVEREKPKPLLVFSVALPATATQVTVSPEFLQGKATYKFEVLAIEAGGNQTITESTFKTQ
jgi:hypothetical protein